MAENAAHIATPLLNSPSIFELIAQESLANLVYPSFKVITQFLESAHPQRYHWLHERNEEVFLVLNGLLQLHFLNINDASLSESFYGLRRCSKTGKAILSVKSKMWSIFCLVGLPYLFQKAEKLTVDLKHRKIELFRGTVVASWQALSLIQYLLYLTGRAQAHSPLLSVANLSLQYNHEQTSSHIEWKNIFSSRRECFRSLCYGLGQTVQLAAFFLQCMHWWQSDSAVHQSLPSSVPPAPKVEAREDSTGKKAICPICKEVCKIETALLSSGYVFCYRCIRGAVSANHKCPVTGLPSTLDELIRLYPTI